MDALYFPNISLPNSAWTYPNLLFFDKIKVIAPLKQNNSYFDEQTKLLYYNELVEIIPPEKYSLIGSNDDDDEIIEYLNANRHLPHNNDITRIHFKKFKGPQLINKLIYNDLLKYADGERINSWLEGPTWVIESLITAMAVSILAKNDDLPLITDRKLSYELFLDKNELNVNKKQFHERSKKLIQTLLPISPNVRLEDLIYFRDKHKYQLKQFRRFVIELSQNNNSDEEYNSLLNEAERIRQHLIGELKSVDSHDNILSFGLSLLSVAAPIVERSTLSAGVAGASLLYLFGQWAYKNQRKGELMQNRLVFAALAEKNLTRT